MSGPPDRSDSTERGAAVDGGDGRGRRRPESQQEQSERSTRGSAGIHSLAGQQSRRGLLIVGIVVLIAIVLGVLLLGGGGSGPGGPGPANESAAGGVGSGGGSSGAQSLAAVVASGQDRSAGLDNYTLTIDAARTDSTGTMVSNLTVKIDAAENRTSSESRVYFPENQSLTILTEAYGDGDAVYVRRSLPSSENGTYRIEDDLPEVGTPDLQEFQDRFDFEYEQTDAGDHRYTVDSVDQYTGELSGDASLENVSATIVVDSEIGMVTEARFRIEASTPDRRVLLTTERTVSNIDATVVSEPEWLSTAKNRIENRSQAR